MRRLLRNPLAVAALVVLLFVLVVTVFAPVFAPDDPNRVIAGLARANPSAAHWMGGDGAGRDVLSRLCFGGRTTLLGAVVTLVVAILCGVLAGLVAGYFGGWFDGLGGWFATMLQAIPGLVLLMALIAAAGPRTVPVMAVFGVLLAPGFFRLTRTAVRQVRGELYLDAARVSGLRDARIVRRHVLPVIRTPIIIQASISAGIAVLIQTGLQFLGLGDTTVASWGQMLADAFTNIYAAPYLVLWPGLAIGLTVAALAVLGSAIGDEATAVPPPVRRREIGTLTDGPMLRVTGLTVSYQDRRVVDDISFAIGAGEVLGLVGESGSGKTQTVLTILGLLPATATTTGTVAVGGRGRRLGGRIAYVPQEPMSNLDPSFTIGAQLTEPLRAVAKMSRAQARRRALELLEKVGIGDPRRVYASYPHQISGGMAQRVLIAGAVAGEPDLLIADEPTSALDVTVQADILDLLRDLQKERGMSMLMVTHDFGVVADICDRVAVMRHGRIVEQDDVRATFAHPGHDYTRTLLEAGLHDTAPRPAL
ncbi:dipeptide/oligopeptide/nickel ABC transporter permease/ATP-binding protein [Actinoplanes sp. NPDC051411]|uniref:dipeptide/oligopeptide/nickel ABC transporter permease/ATP-binding protein n=1 Tax=Actinoplanes sp. NPDC051411 TaxID=3155522 RepID=UPI003440182C